MIAKGVWNPETGYSYTCLKCRGKGKVGGEDCPDCYGLDYDKLLEAFAVARGERYYALLKAILSIHGLNIVRRAKEMKAERGKFTAYDMVRLMVEFRFPRNRLKPLAEWLEEVRFCPSGMYEFLREHGFTVKRALEEMEIEYP